MRDKLPVCLERTRDVPADIDVLHRWCMYKNDLPGWSAAARIVLSLSPSSAAAEWVFSMMKNMLSDTQGSFLADAMEASLMMKFNSATTVEPTGTIPEPVPKSVPHADNLLACL